METFTTRLKVMESDIWGYFIPVPPAIAETFVDGPRDRRVLCTLNEEHTFHCALMPGGRGSWFITVNKEIRKKLGIRQGMELRVQLQKDDSPYGMPLPEELEALFEMDPDFSRYFHDLSPGKQRSLIHLVGKPKKSDTRLRKALVIADYLKWAEGKLDYKELNQAFREANS
jgi:hypothetical protein